MRTALSRRSLLALGIISLLPLPSVVSAAGGAAQQVLTAEPLDRFDGESWSGLHIGKSTRDEIKRSYRTTGGQFIRPEALILTPPPGISGLQALLNGRKGDSQLVGIRLTYGDRGPDPKELADRLKEEPEVWYPIDRYEDWFIQVFPKEGIILYMLREGRDDRVPQVLLAAPNRVNDILRSFKKDETDIQKRKEFHEEDLLPVEVGDVRLSFGSIKGVTVRDKDIVQDDLTEDIRRELRSGRTMEYRRNGKGDLSITVSVNYKSGKGGDVTASASLNTSTELGKIYASSSYTDNIRDEGDDPRWTGTRRFERAVFKALEDLERDVREKVHKQQPPPLSTVRQQAWDDVINRYVR